MSEYIAASPLTWPEGWARIKMQIDSRFGHWNKPVSIAKATYFVLDQLRIMGIPDFNVIISSDLRLRNDGLPYSTQRDPEDSGIAVWWKDGKTQQVIALDKYKRIADNLYAVGKTLEAMRGIERWGSVEILNRTFTGFVALPDNSSKWRSVLGDANTLGEARTLFKMKRGPAHPDKGGSTKAFNEVNQAWEDAQLEFK